MRRQDWRDLAIKVVRDHDSSEDRGLFGVFMSAVTRSGLPVRVCGSVRKGTAKGEDWTPYNAYLAIFDAYAGHYGRDIAAPYMEIPAWPEYTGSWVDDLPRSSTKALVDALVAACDIEGVTNPMGSKAVRPPQRSRRQLSEFPKRDHRATVLSFGAGRDSAVLALIFAAYDDPWLKAHYPKAAKEARRYRHAHPLLDLIGAFSDTGYEFPFTYAAYDAIESFVANSAHPYRMITLKKPPVSYRDMMTAARGSGLKPRTLGDAAIRKNQRWSWAVPGETPEQAAERGKYHLKPPIPWEHGLSGTLTARDNASCTFGQKIDPIKRFLHDLSARLAPGVVQPWRQDGRRTTIAPWTDMVKRGVRKPHRSIIGINADEIGRADLRIGGRWPARVVPYDTCSWGSGHRYEPKRGYDGACYRDSIAEYHYPLIDWGIGEEAEGEILEHYGFGWIRKSGCMSCHWMPPGWWWAESLEYPEQYEQSVAMEIGALLRRRVMIGQILAILTASRDRVGKVNARSVRKDVIETLGTLAWRQMEDWARARRLTMNRYVNAVLNESITPVKPMVLGSFRNYPLPCIVAWFQSEHGQASSQGVFAKTYTRKGGAANRYCDCEGCP